MYRLLQRSNRSLHLWASVAVCAADLIGGLCLLDRELAAACVLLASAAFSGAVTIVER